MGYILQDIVGVCLSGFKRAAFGVPEMMDRELPYTGDIKIPISMRCC